jgi:hypothetical protein
MQRETKQNIERGSEIIRELTGNIDRINCLLDEANELGIYVLITKEESNASPPKITIKINKATYPVEFVEQPSIK